MKHIKFGFLKEKSHIEQVLLFPVKIGIVIFDLSDIELDKQDKIAITLEPSPNNQAPEGDIIMAGEKVRYF